MPTPKRQPKPSPANGGHAGVVYTKPWVIELMLDLAGYIPDRDLANCVALEPSAGDGAFLLSMVRRLVTSCRRHHRPLSAAKTALRAYEIDPAAVEEAINSVESELIRVGESGESAAMLARGWIRHEDFLEASLQFPVADFVAGNPPYIRLEEIPSAKADTYRNAYRTMTGRSDLYVAFYEAALAQLKPGGVCAYICADRWMLNDYGRGLREFIAEGYAVKYLIDAHEVEAFETEVSAYPSITIISYAQQEEVFVAKALPGIENQTTETLVGKLVAGQSSPTLQVAKFRDWFKGSAPWPCSSPQSLGLLRELEAKFPPLEVKGDTIIGIGVATGADEVYISNQRPDIEKDRLLPMAMASDLSDGKVDWSGHYLVNPWNRDGLVKLSDYPKLSKYLAPHQGALSARHTAKSRPDAWHKTIDRVNLDLLTQAKLYIPDIKDRLTPSLDLGKTYPHHNVYWITSKSWDLRVLGGLLMSSAVEFFIRSYGVKMRGGYLRFQAQYLRRICAPRPDDLSPEISAMLARAFDTQNVALATEAAFQLYGITKIPAVA